MIDDGSNGAVDVDNGAAAIRRAGRGEVNEATAAGSIGGAIGGATGIIAGATGTTGAIAGTGAGADGTEIDFSFEWLEATRSAFEAFESWIQAWQARDGFLSPTACMALFTEHPAQTLSPHDLRAQK